MPLRLQIPEGHYRIHMISDLWQLPLNYKQLNLNPSSVTSKYQL